MFKKVALYGLAFGSASAAMLLIQYENGLYRSPGTFLAALPLIANLVFPGIGVFLFIKSISVMKTKKPINMGKALFGALLVSALNSACNIAAYQHIMYNRQEIVADVRQHQYTGIERAYNSDTTLNQDKRAENIQLAKDNFEKNISISSFARVQFMMCLSTGMVVALLTFMWNTRK